MVQVTGSGPRPATWLLAAGILCLAVTVVLAVSAHHRRNHLAAQLPLLTRLTAVLGASDLCFSTEARYTRHPAASDPLVPFMDHPGAIEHFPSGSFWVPPGR